MFLNKYFLSTPCSMNSLFDELFRDFGQNFREVCGQMSSGHKIECTALLGQKDTVYSSTGTEH